MRNHIRYHRLMEASEQRLSAAMRSGIPSEELVAERIFDNPRDYSRWESHHAGLMRRIDAAGDRRAQQFGLLSASLGFIHRKALFECLQDGQIRGRDRVRLFEHLSGHTDYSAAVIAQHGIYLRSAASYLCSQHVGARLLRDRRFDRALPEYEALYLEYFSAYCDLALASDEAVAACVRPTLTSLKQRLCHKRARLLALVHS